MKNILTWILLILILTINIFIAFKVLTHYEMYSNDPLVYGAKTHDLDFCNCYKDGKEFHFNQEKVWYIPSIYEENLTWKS